MAKKPDVNEKNIRGQLQKEPIRRTGKKGQTIASLSFLREGDSEDNAVNVALSGDPADQFFTQFEEEAVNRGEEQSDFRPHLEFDGFWSSNDWKNRDGKTITSWTFWSNKFEFVLT